MMKVKYRFNPESLSYDKVKTSFKAWILKFFTFFTASIVISIIYYVVFSYFFNSPKEKALIRVNDQMKLQYELATKRLDEMSKVLDDMQQRDDNLYRVVFEAEPISRSVREAGFGGVNRYEELEKATNNQLVVETSKKLDIVSKRMYIQSKSFDEVISKAKYKGQMLMCTPNIQPVANKDLKKTASGYGWRIHPIYKIRKFHEGMDFTAPVGTPVYATADGTIAEEGRDAGYGNKLLINHGFGYETLYAHLEQFNVRLGQKVKRGDLVGYVGNTGLSTGPHLHYEVHKGGKPQNPAYFYFNDLTPSDFNQVLEISSSMGQTFD
ncbi:MAG: M23 family metallopeptidase [Bacteroidota bacterium]|nr:M23 family metallopeptidase [Bacteroidota bacterium]